MTNKASYHFLNYPLMKSFDFHSFQTKSPFPWSNIHGVLTGEGFHSLWESFPSLELFEHHLNIKRLHGQRPHNRYYLAYESSIYHKENSQKGTIQLNELPLPWQSFLHELESNSDFRRFIKKALNVSEYTVRYAWHVGFENCEVSPHVDATEKIGTHIFYFNTENDWDVDWGGSTLVLDEMKVNRLNPDFEDFSIAIPTKILDNHSFLFKNTPTAWHGVRPLDCPPEKYRRLFNVIFEFPTNS